MRIKTYYQNVLRTSYAFLLNYMKFLIWLFKKKK